MGRRASIGGVSLGKEQDFVFDLTGILRTGVRDAVDTAAVAKELPYGTVNVTAVKGGLEVPAESGSDSIIIANAAVIVSFDDGKTG